jgi:hypothetical protein
MSSCAEQSRWCWEEWEPSFLGEQGSAPKFADFWITALYLKKTVSCLLIQLLCFHTSEGGIKGAKKKLSRLLFRVKIGIIIWK